MVVAAAVVWGKWEAGEGGRRGLQCGGERARGREGEQDMEGGEDERGFL